MATPVLYWKPGDIEIAYAEGAEEGACVFEVGERGRAHRDRGSSGRGRCGVKQALNGGGARKVECKIVKVRRREEDM